MAYEVFADVYDLLNEEADYEALHTQVVQRLRRHGIADGIVVDLGCGTGELTLRLAQDGYDMIGVDVSPEMLCVLREKAEELGLPGVLLLCQDLVELDLYGTVRAAVSTFDTFNHIGPLGQLRTAIAQAALFIEPGGVMIFDMNTPYKHQCVLGDQTFEIEADDVTCVWKNRYDAAKRCTHMTIDLQDVESGTAAHETICEYSYTLDEIQQACADAGLTITEVCDGERFCALLPNSERYLITAVKQAV